MSNPPTKDADNRPSPPPAKMIMLISVTVDNTDDLSKKLSEVPIADFYKEHQP